MVAPLRTVAHDPLSDPELFWSDQVVGVGRDRTVSDARSLGVHGRKGNYVVITERSGAGSVVAAAVETSGGVYLIGFRAPDELAAKDRFQRLIDTFDDR